jgi:transposase
VGLPRWVGRAIGLDVHRDFCEVAICEDGEVRSAGRVPSTPEGIGTLAESLLLSDRVALEVTGSCWEVARILEPRVNRVVVVSPDDTGITSARAKTDKLDARALARLLWAGELEAVWMPDERCRILRRRLARREQLVRSRSRAKNEIHASLQRRLQAKPPCSDLFGVKGRHWLAGLELPLEERESVDAGMRHIEFLDVEIAAAEKLIAQQALSWPEIRRLMTVPGVNLIGAATFLAAVGNANRFLSSRKLVAYLGLDPRVKQSGEDSGAQRTDLQTRIGVRTLGAGRSGVERGPATRTSAGVLSARARPSRARQGDRRDRTQAGDPVLVHAHPLTGLRPSATVADPQEAPSARDHRRRPEIHPQGG